MVPAHRLLFLFVFLVMMSMPLSSGAGEDYGEPDELLADSEAVLRSFMTDPQMEWFRRELASAQGIFIVPRMLRAGFVVGGSGGSGVLLARDMNSGTWSPPAFYSMGSVSVGLQIGAEASEIILLIMTQKGINAMLTPEFKLGGDISVAAGPVGGTAKAQTADILAYGRSMGAYGGLSIEGAMINPRNDYNAALYGQPVYPADILVRRSVSSEKAAGLLGTMPKYPSHKPLGR